jgi:hypothetical protein
MNKTTKNIPATLDLNKSLSDFEAALAPALSLANVAEWDGRTIKEREEQIRVAALVLAGQCIALLVFNLSQSESAQKTAINQTKGWWHPKTRKHGYCHRQLLTIGNVVVDLKLPYVVERRAKPKGKRKSLHQGFCPLLRWLGMSEGITPLVWSTIAEYGMIGSSFAIARSNLIQWGINISLKRIERLTYHFGGFGISQRDLKLSKLSQSTLPTGSVLKSQRVVISVDGGRTKLRINKIGRRHAKTHSHGYVGEWVEPKLLTIYAVDEQGKKLKTSEIPITNDGTYENYQILLNILEMHLVSLGINQAKQVLLISDAAEWIWKHIPALLKRLGSPTETFHLLDFYHVTEHLHAFAEAAFSQAPERKKWFYSARSDLKRGKITQVLEQMTALSKQANGETLEIMMTEINHLTKGHVEGRLNYARIAALKLPIGSGAIESLVRQVVNLRMKGNGKFWLRNHAEIMLHARCQWTAGNWQTFSDSILTALINPG